MFERFSTDDALKFGWNTMKSNIGFFIAFLGVLLLISLALGYVEESVKADKLIARIIDIISWCVNSLLTIGIIKIMLSFCDEEKAEFADLFSGFDCLFKYMIAWVLYVLIILGGLILLIVPGIMWAIKFQFFGYLMIDQGLEPIDALKESARITRGIKGDLLLFSLLLAAINVLGALCLLVGLFATIPTTMLAYGYVYRELIPRPRERLSPLVSQDETIRGDYKE